VIRPIFLILGLFLSGFSWQNHPILAHPSKLLEPSPQVIISDWHIGTTLWQVAVLKALGVPVEAYSLSGHRRYAAGDPSFREDPLFLHLPEWSEATVHQEFFKNPRWAQVTHAIASFPPSYIETLKKLPSQVALLLNIGHRIHISISPNHLIEFTERVIQISRDPRYLLATMSEYDFHYLRYYTGLEPLRLPVISQHIPQTLREAPYAPRSRVILIGPSHNTETIIGFENNLKRLNRLSAAFASRHGLKPYTFNFIKAVYPGDQATPENLAKHPAVLINPYSAFSISMVELYHLNIPFFVPDDSLLIHAMGDVRLYPLYQNKEAIAQLEAHYPVGSSGYPYSPNDESPEAQRYWLQFMFFNQLKHVQRWRTPEELFQKLYLNDLRQLHDAMQAENTQVFDQELSKWATLFGKNHPIQKGS